MRVLISELNAAVAANASPPIPGPYNGTLGTVDMAKPVDYSSDWGKVCVVSNNFSLKETLRYYIWLAQEKPAANRTLIQDDVDKVLPALRRAIARERIYTIFKRSGVRPEFRASDIAPVVATGGVNDTVLKELYGLLTGSETADIGIAEEGRHVLLSLMANAIHRSQHNSHSWFTKEMNNPNSLTYKACAVAAEGTVAFAAFMRKEGHDINHHLTDRCLDKMALALVGKEEPHALIPPAPPSGANRVPGPEDMYAGEDIRGKRVCDIFKLPESCIDRYPPGELGKAALIIGLGYLLSMINAITAKVKVEGTGAVTSNLTLFASAARTQTLGRNLLNSIESALGPVLSFAHGFAIENGTLALEAYPAYDSHAKRFAGDSADGKAFAMVLKSVNPHPEAVGSAVANLVNRIGAAVNGLSAVASTTVGNLTAHDGTKVTVKVAPTETDRMLSIMQGIKDASNA